MNKIKFFKFLTVVVVSILLIASFVLGSQNNTSIANATSKEQNGVITVSGEGVIKVKPDIAYISLGVQTQNSNAKVAQSDNATKMNNVMAALKQQGIKDEDIQTIQYNIYPNHRYNPNTGQSTVDGYVVQNTVRVIIRDINSVGTVIDAVAKNDSNILNSIEFSISDSSKYYAEALTKATKDAKAKAEVIAKSVDVKISKPTKIIEAGQSEPVLYNTRALMDAKLETATAISAGMLEVKASVIAEYSY
ncbi:SIMPL domain-containing protein [Serpentinicella alkaliphila]|uniref:SIMPL domain-containing protein n=1 Tax=Serpentinicella alkaliphila TaxID=1734049 RepID=A0A4V2T3Y0_9FIRM|nr:SIMPL domain-containing protein [Serpentinicella alkaliphila]QUH24689.1 SIMPL domain-containing protein [Serpentinicella alkaliphila]TCQ03044.1 hypothetical protein EDD79_10116 [Serpentinicella alkaliphila]